MIKTLSLIFFFTTSILAFSVELDQRSPGDNIWSGCKNVSYAGISINNACILLTEGTDCSLDVTFAISGTEVLSQNMDLSVVPEVCGSYSGCDYCLTIGINPDDTSQRCVTVSPKCGVFQLPTITAGCFPNSALANLISCEQNKCPNDCNGHGTCNAGVCTCDTGFYGEDCNSTGDLFHQCERLDQIGADVCARVKFEPCNLVVEIVLEGNGQEMTLFSQDYPVQTFKQVFQSDAQCADTGVCKICLKWTDLTLTEIEAHGCGSLELTCLGVTYPYSLGCFDDNEVVPQCFGTCPKNCSYNGYCYRGACQCEDDWQGDDCGTPREYCPHYCSGHGTCNKLEGVCTCDSGYSGTDCSRVVPPHDTSSEKVKGGVTIVMILVPVCVVVVIGVVAVAIWYVRKQKKNAGPQFHQLDLLEDDQEGLMEEME